MLAYLVKRTAWAGVLFLVITMVTFVLFFVLPVSNARFVRRTEFGSNDFKRALAVDGPIYKQYGQFVARIVKHGSLGASYDRLGPGEQQVAVESEDLSAFAVLVQHLLRRCWPFPERWVAGQVPDALDGRACAARHVQEVQLQLP